MRYLKLFFCIAFLLGCKQEHKSWEEKMANCTFIMDKKAIENSIFPFDINKFTLDEILSFCPKNIVVDSLIYSDDCNIVYYTISKDSSFIKIIKNTSSQNIKRKELWTCSFYSNVFESTKIRIGIDRKEFFKVLKLKNGECESVIIKTSYSSNNLFDNFYYQFIFKDNRLIEIYRSTIDL